MSTFDPGTEIHGSDPQSAVLEGASQEAIKGRSLSQIAWRRLRRDKVAIAGGCFIIILVLVAASVIINFVRSGGRNV